MSRHQKLRQSPAFTIVELLIVIVVIGVLAAIVVVSYTGITRSSKITVLQHDLANADRQLRVHYSTHGDSYPEDLGEVNDGGLQFTEEADLQYVARNDENPKSYCLTASIDDLTYYIEYGYGPREGFCQEHNPNIAPNSPTITTHVDSQTAITVSWAAVGDPLTDEPSQIASSYRLEYSTSDTFSPLSTINGITDTSRQVTGLSAATTYYFRVYAIGPTDNASAPSVVVSDQTQAAPPSGAPTIACTVNSSTQITITRSTSVSGATSYTLQRSTASDFSSSVTDTSGITGSSTSVTGLSQGMRYYFRMYSVGAGGNGPNSTAVNCTTTIDAPDSPTVTVSIPGGTRAASSGPWAKTSAGDPTSGTWYYAQGVVSSSTCPAGTTRQARARIQYNGGGSWGAWTSYQSASTFYGINPSSGYAIKFQVTTRCYTSYATSAASTSGQGCRAYPNNAISCW